VYQQSTILVVRIVNRVEAHDLFPVRYTPEIRYFSRGLCFQLPNKNFKQCVFFSVYFVQSTAVLMIDIFHYTSAWAKL
jgi:hypothetical protein